MSASFTVNCEGEGDRCVTEIVNLVTQEINATNASEAGFIKEIEDMTDEQIQQLMEDFLEELDDDSEEEDNDND